MAGLLRRRRNLIHLPLGERQPPKRIDIADVQYPALVPRHGDFASPVIWGSQLNTAYECER